MAMLQRQLLVFDAVAGVVNVPINEQIAAWNPSALSVGYDELLHRWWQWHQLRVVSLVSGLRLIYVAMLVRRQRP